ncbi:hypothetical protein BC567DRAFT_239530 [Phyllosticta citribraziliensis]
MRHRAEETLSRRVMWSTSVRTRQIPLQPAKRQVLHTRRPSPGPARCTSRVLLSRVLVGRIKCWRRCVARRPRTARDGGRGTREGCWTSAGGGRESCAGGFWCVEQLGWATTVSTVAVVFGQWGGRVLYSCQRPLRHDGNERDEDLEACLSPRL